MPIRIVLYQQDGDWIAHCLEFDLCGDGNTQKEALDNLDRAISIQIEESVVHDNAANLFSPADARIFQMFAEGKDRVVNVPVIQLSTATVEIQDVTAREYTTDLVSA
jgi:predicted RNase H-like HicB family nuclease